MFGNHNQTDLVQKKSNGKTFWIRAQGQRSNFSTSEPVIGNCMENFITANFCTIFTVIVLVLFLNVRRRERW